MVNIFTVDLEDYFHPTEVNRGIGDWSDFSSRVGIGTGALLDLLAEHNVRATFFVLGWVAKTQPLLVRRIAEAGHEIGCHSFKHQLVFNLTPREFREDTIQAVDAIEDACGVVPKVYRAPSYSIVAKSLWALDVLADLGFTHDSSICPIVHDRYGIPGFPRHAHMIDTTAGPIMEVPIATVQLSTKQVAPVGGGAYLRLFPYRYTATGIREINNVEGRPACIYTHPWELDPNQPRVANGFISRVRTYTGLAGVRRKLDRLLTDFDFSTMGAVYPSAESAQLTESRLVSSVVSV
jgi:polysaccharide deacetylase family protein (PEP-CTERM system associated)